MEKLTACIFVRTIVAVLVAIAEKTLVDADGVAARKLSDLTERLICAEQRLNFPLLGQLVTVLHSPLPITRLLLQVKRQARGASDGLQALEKGFIKANSLKVTSALTPAVHWMTSLQESFPDFSRNNSPALFPRQSFCS